MKQKFLLLIVPILIGTSRIFAQADVQELISMIKKNLAESKEHVKQYEWLEATTTFVKGEQKSLKQNQCYYSVEGKLTKVETGGSTQAKKKGGIRGKIADNKKEDMADYIKSAIEKIHTYLPPDAAKLQKIYGAGKSTIQVLEPGKKFKISFPDYNEKGDMISISIDKSTQKLMSLDVSTYIDGPDKKVIFNVTYGDLPDGTQYESSTTLDAQAKDLKIVIANSGYKKGAGK